VPETAQQISIKGRHGESIPAAGHSVFTAAGITGQSPRLGQERLGEAGRGGVVFSIRRISKIWRNVG
jgi:hypothetical protein